jgi:hypothetical protein
MANDNNNSNNPTVIRWRDNKTTQYDATDLAFVRKKDPDGGRFGYFNPHKSAYEVPLDIVEIPKELVEIQERRSEAKEAKLILRSAGVKTKDDVKPRGHLRLHQHYSTLTA